MSYLRRPGRLALLIGASVLTYGIGGIVVHGLCRGERYCPNCGLRWRNLARSSGLESLELLSDDAGKTPEELAKLKRKTKRWDRFWHLSRFLWPVLGMIGVFEATGGILGGNLAEVLGGLSQTVAAALFFIMSWLELDRPSANQDNARKVLMLADRRGGVLAVGDIAAELDIGLDAVEELMAAMDDGFRVRSDIGADGAVWYEFPEVRHHKKLDRR